jgi:hypothetical protein
MFVHIREAQRVNMYTVLWAWSTDSSRSIAA